MGSHVYINGDNCFYDRAELLIQMVCFVHSSVDCGESAD